MKKMKTIRIILAVLSLATLSSLNTAYANAVSCNYSNIQTAVTAVKLVDATDIAVFHSEEGRKEFTRGYGITFPQKIVWQSNSLYLAVFTLPHIGVERVSKYRRNEITIDLFDTGEDIEMIAPPEGTSWMIVHLLQIEEATTSSGIVIRKAVTPKRLEFGK